MHNRAARTEYQRFILSKQETEDSVRNLSVEICILMVGNQADKSRVSLIPPRFKGVFLIEGVTEEAVQALPQTIEWCALDDPNVSPVVLSKISTAIQCMHIGPSVTAAQLQSIPATVIVLYFYGKFSPDKMSAIPAHVAVVYVSGENPDAFQKVPSKVRTKVMHTRQLSSLLCINAEDKRANTVDHSSSNDAKRPHINQKDKEEKVAQAAPVKNGLSHEQKIIELQATVKTLQAERDAVVAASNLHFVRCQEWQQHANISAAQLAEERQKTSACNLQLSQAQRRIEYLEGFKEELDAQLVRERESNALLQKVVTDNEDMLRQDDETMDQLEDKNKRLVTRNDALRNKCESNKKTLQDLLTKITGHEDQITRLNEQVSALLAINHTAQQERVSLLDAIKKLQDERRELLDEVARATRATLSIMQANNATNFASYPGLFPRSNSSNMLADSTERLAPTSP